MAKNSKNKLEKRSSETELVKKPKEVLAKYIIHLENEWFNFSEENKKLKTKVSELEKQKLKIKQPKASKKYDKKSSWIDKLVFIFEKNGNPMNIGEIKSEFLLLEPEIKFQWTNLDNQISQLLYRACMAKVIIKKKLNGEIKYLIN